MYGTTPKQYQLQLRIARARGLLAHGSRPAVVAQQTGFVDQAHFHRYFARFMGVTPNAYRRAVTRSG
jgi:transcriptional regulator GlxA family with amidase domain